MFGIEDMLQIKIAVEGMKAQIVQAFNSDDISRAVKMAADKALLEFNMDKFITDTIEQVLYSAKEEALKELSQQYGSKWADKIAEKIDEKIEELTKKV